MRARARFAAPGLAALLALSGLLLTGSSSAGYPAGRVVPASRAAPAGHRGTGGPAGDRTGPAASLLRRVPAPGLGAGGSRKFAVPVALAAAARKPAVARLGPLRPADLLVVAPRALPRGAAAAVRRLPGVSAAQPLDAARLHLNGKLVAMLGVDPATFRPFAPPLVARSGRLWQGVAAGNVAVSYTMGKLDRLPLGGMVTLAGVRQEKRRVGSFATVGIPGVDAVVSSQVARSLGFPAGNAIVVSAPHAMLTRLAARIKRLVPRDAAVQPLVSQASVSGAAGTAGVAGVSAKGIGRYPTLTSAQLTAMLKAAISRRGLPYVWGGNGPRDFDCSGLVQWSFARAGIAMPRVAADQALTGPAVPLSRLAPGDLLFYHTDPSAPRYISHVAIYLGHGLMIQAPEPGLDVEIVPAALGAGFAGAVRVDPRIAAQLAGASV